MVRVRNNTQKMFVGMPLCVLRHATRATEQEGNTFLVMRKAMRGVAVTSREAMPACCISLAVSDDDDDVNADGFMCAPCIVVFSAHWA